MSTDWDAEARRIVGKPILECTWAERRVIEDALAKEETDSTEQPDRSNA